MGQTSETPVCDVVNIKNRIRDTAVPQYPLCIIDYKQDEAQKHGPDVPLLCVFVHYASEGGAGAGAGVAGRGEAEQERGARVRRGGARQDGLLLVG